MKSLPKPERKVEYVPLDGGEDQITPTLSVNPGRAILAQNYELDLYGRYRLISGYEAYDGRPKPSEASYWILGFDTGTSEIAVADTVTGAAGATGEALVIEVESGSWAGGDAAGYLVLFNVVGVYVDDEILSVGGNPMAIADGTAAENDASTDELDSIYKLATIEAVRDDIQAVPGSGNVLGVWQFGDVKYAFRNNAAGTATVMHKSSATGWTACSLGERLGFDTGTVAFVEGETITQGAVTAVVRRVVAKDGTWGGGDAEGFFVISGRAGGAFAAGAVTGSIAGAANATAVQTTNAFSVPGGRFEFVNYNFYGSSSTKRMYGCDGKNKAFEWDGTYYTPIETGMAVDAPEHILAHRSHLFLSFAGGSLQHSSLGEPHLWSVVTGAAELGLGDECTGMLSMPDLLVAFCRNSTSLLYGTSIADWELTPLSNESGAIEWTIQKMGPGLYLDDRGVTSLSAVQEYGDLNANTLSKYINPLTKEKLSIVQNSVRIKDKNQYRLFFTDRSAITMTLNTGDDEDAVGFTRQYYDKLPVCICSTENSSGEEEIYFGSTDGFVYQMDKGTSFNGNAIEAMIKFHFNHLDSPSTKKRIRKIVLELVSPINTYVSASVEFNYGETGNQATVFANEAPGGYWDVDLWDLIVWNGVSVSSAPLYVDGTGLNFSLTIYHSGVWELQGVGGRSGLTGAEPHTIQGYVVNYDTRGIQR
uniref:Uncharacterized protein n=1 Tax=viral metagenome TaxID=1070528 RepID=A0A6H1ZY33_9ZZZZ